MGRPLLAIALIGILGCSSSQAATPDAGGDTAQDGGSFGSGDGGGPPLFGDAATEGGTTTTNGCSEAATLIYVVANDDMSLYSFYPPTLTFTKIGLLACEPQSAPFAMSVARDGTAWVLYQDGKIFRVSTKDATCAPTSFVQAQSGFINFGMGFSADAPGSTSETLFVCWTQGLAKIDTTSLVLTPIGTMPGLTLTSGCDLTGTGDGVLYSFIPQASDWLIATLDKTTSAPTSQRSLTPPIPAGGAWGTSFWGGDLYLYTTPGNAGSTVWKYDPINGTTIMLKADIGFSIVGAGESTCAPTSPVK